MVLVLIALVFVTVSPSWATTIRLVEETPGNYLIEGDVLDGVSALDLTLDYETDALHISSVTPGPLLQGMLFASNLHQPGRVRIGAIGTQSLSGSGTLVRLEGSGEEFPAAILEFTVKLSDSSGRLLPVQVQYQNLSPVENPTQPATPSSQVPIDAPSSSLARQGRSGLVPGRNVAFPAPWSSSRTVSPPPSKKVEPYVVLPAEQKPRRRAAIREALRKNESAPVAYTEKQKVNLLPIQEFFETYEGPRTLARMAILFNRETSGLQQRPEILLADGETPVEIEFPANDSKEPSFALMNARLLWAGVVGEGRYLVRCLPEKGALSAKLLLLGSKEMLKVPLTVVPPVSLVGVEARAGEPLPKLDLDGDGESTWMDDYILVANLLAQGKSDKGKEGANQRR